MQLKSLLGIPLGLLHWVVRSIPTRAGVFVRRVLYGPLFRRAEAFDMEAGVDIHGFHGISIGRGTTFSQYCDLHAAHSRLTIGQDCFFGRGVRLGSDGGGQVTIGDHVMMGPNVVVDCSVHNHASVQVPMKEQGLTHGTIVIEDDVWIGANAVVLKDVTIGKGSIIGAGAVVTGDIPAYSVAVGVPAKVVKTRSHS